MSEFKKVKLPQFEVVYYNNVAYSEKVKRLVKVTAILKMVSLKRGYVISAKIEPLDKSGDYLITEEMVNAEIGKRKNLISCYEVTQLT